MAKQGRPLAVLTGASSGIGEALAWQFAKHGFDLVIAAEESAIDQAASALRATGASVEAVRVNLATAEGCRELENRVDALGVPLEAIALNAGVGVGGDFARETPLDEELNVIDLNVVSTVRLAKWAAKKMVAAGRGRILVTTSIAGIMPTPLAAIYGATKAFDLAFAAALHHELKDTGVTVTAMLPGPTDTEFFRRAGIEDTKLAEEAKKNDPAEVARQGFEALMAGEERVAAGNFGVKLQAHLARFMPEGMKAALHRKQAEPGSRTSS